jgi:hypothetical protein
VASVAATEAAATEATKAAIPDYYTNKDYKYDTYSDFDAADIEGLAPKDLKALYSSKLVTAKADVAQADKDYKAALKSGDAKRTQAALKNLQAQNAEVTAIKLKQNPPKVKAVKATPVAKAVKAAPVAKPKVVKAAPVAKPKVVKAAPVAKPKVVKAAPVAKPKVVKAAPVAKAATVKATPVAKSTKKKATGGIIHNGMSNNLKKMLGE